MPKSSIASRTPIAFRRSSTSVAASGSASTALSVISRHSSSGSRPLAVSASSTTPTNSLSASWRGETLTDMLDSRGRARATQSAACRQASVDDPRADRDDQAGLLGDRDEDGRDDEPALGVLPAHQRLGADDAAVAHLDLRLVEHASARRARARAAARPRGRGARRPSRASTRRRSRSAPCRAPWRGTWRRRRRAAAPPGRRRRPARCARRSSRSRSAGGPRARPARAGRWPAGRRRGGRRPRPPTAIITANSSPPKRAITSPGRSTRRMRSATTSSRRSPAPWPSESLMILKLSRSTNSTATSSPPLGDRLVQALQEERPVRQAGERVVVRLVVELALDALARGDVEDVADPVRGRVAAVVGPASAATGPSRRPVGAHEAALDLDARQRRPGAVAVLLGREVVEAPSPTSSSSPRPVAAQRQR